MCGIYPSAVRRVSDRAPGRGENPRTVCSLRASIKGKWATRTTIMTRPRVPHPSLMTSQPRTSSTEECRQRASVGRAPLVQNQRSLVKITGFPQNTLRVSRVLRDQPHNRESADLMHWSMHRFPPPRQFTFAHGGGGLLKLTIVIAVSFLHQTEGAVRAACPVVISQLERSSSASRPREIFDGFSSCPAQPPRQFTSVATGTSPPSSPLIPRPSSIPLF